MMASVYGSAVGGGTISFAHRLAVSPRFKALFRDGMDLVEEVAAYLDGPGRDEARQLPRPVAIAYAAESMRLTTRLMQVASWLLVQRAVNEGEMDPTQAEGEKRRARLQPQEMASGAGVFAQLPPTLQELTNRSLRLQNRILYLDRTIRLPEEDAAPAPVIAMTALALQHERIRQAFAVG